MAKFTDQLSTPTNQIQARPLTPKQSTLGVAATVASNVLGPLVAEIKERGDNTKLDQMSGIMEKEFKVLSEARRQGSISTTEFFTRLNAKSRQLSADFPAVATEWRARVKEDFGSPLQKQEFEAEVDTFKLEEQQKDKMFTEALSFNLGVFKEGKIDKDETVARFADIRRQQLMASIAGKSGSKQAAIEVQSSLQTIFNRNVDTIMGQIGQLGTGVRPGGPLKEAEVLSASQEILANAERQFMIGNTLPILADSDLSPEDTKKIREEFTNQFALINDYIVSGEKGFLRKRQRSVTEVSTALGLDMQAIMPEMKAFRETFGDEATSNVVGTAFAVRPLGVNALTPQQELSRKLSTSLGKLELFKNTTDVMKGEKDISSLPAEQKPLVIRSMIDIKNDLIKVDKLGDKQQNSLVSTTTNLTRAAKDSPIRSDVDYQLNELNDPLLFKHLQDAKNTGLKENVLNTATETAELAYTYLERQKPRFEAEILKNVIGLDGDPYADVLFNSRTGELELVFDETAVRNEATSRTRLRAAAELTPKIPSFAIGRTTPEAIKTAAINATAKSIKPYNDALNVFSRSAKLRGGFDQTSDQALKQILIDRYGYRTNPLHPRAEGKIPLDQVLPEVPATGGTDETKRIKLRLNDDLTLSPRD